MSGNFERRSLVLTHEEWKGLEELAIIHQALAAAGTNFGNPSWRRLIKQIGNKKYRIKKETAMDDKTIETLAEEIYSEVFGVIDNKFTRITKCGEIQDWLEDGDDIGSRSLDSLVAEWREYDIDDILSYAV